MSRVSMVAAIRAAMHKHVTCPSCRHRQEAPKNKSEMKCHKCGVHIKLKHK